MFDDLLTKLELEDSTLQDKEDDGDNLGQEDDVMMEEVSALGGIGRGQMQFSWDLEEDQPPRGSPSLAHQAAIEMLQSAHEDQVLQLGNQDQALCEIRGLLSSQVLEYHTFERKIGLIDSLISRHGLVAAAIDMALTRGEGTDPTVISAQLDQFQQELDKVVAETETSKNTLLQLMMRVCDSASRQFEPFDHCLLAVESVRHKTDGGERTIASTSLPQGLTADTIFGMGHVGGVSMDLMMNALFAMVRTLEAKVQVLSDRTKNIGIQFGNIAYASETEFNTAYHTANLSGAGPAGFVDIILMWQYSAASHSGNANNWLSQE